jgi:hypothetical protein
MSQCSPNAILAACSDFTGKGAGELAIIKTELLRQILLAANPMAACDAQSLLAEGACWSCYPGGQLQLIQTQILCEILHTGGGGNVNACLVAQSGGPVDPCAFAFGLGYDNDSTSPTAGQWKFWDQTGNAWVPFIL